MLPTGTLPVSQVAPTAAMVAITTSTRTVSIGLSAVPNVLMAHSRTGPGVRSMTTDPTAVRASDTGPKNTASNPVTPRATAAAATPASAGAGRVPVTI